MGCCGQKRAEAASTTPRASDRTAAQPQIQRTATPRSQADNGRSTQHSRPGNALPGSVMVRYLGSAPVRVPGPVTGRAYLFSEASPVQIVAAQDAPALLGTSSFRPEG